MTTCRGSSLTVWVLGMLLLVHGAVGVAIAAPAAAAPAAHGHTEATAGPTANEGLQRLIEGNQRFVAGTSKHPNQSRARRDELAASQHPFATILGCSDS
ncbi:MAG: carbonic anhydrase, partial [Candidatus Eisenbacteria bacterium]